MEILLEMEKENYPKVKDILLKDDIVSRASIKFREEEEKCYCHVAGLKDHCKKALELIKDEDGNELAKEVTGKDKKEIINKFKEEEDRAMEGFGGIFG